MTGKLVQFETTSANPQFEGVVDISPAELARVKENVKLIDVRQPDEYVGELGHISGTELIVLNTLPEQLNNLPKDQAVVFVCRSGARSAQATAFAMSNGWTHVYNMQGGMILWNNLQLPVER